jgi:hypothetical protein
MTEQAYGPIEIRDPVAHPSRKVVEVLPTSVKSGPNSWSQIHPSDFGPTWDYELENHITLWIFTPISFAALQWCFCRLPEGSRRWGARGYVLEAHEVNAIVKAATRDSLMSDTEYERAMNESELISQQGVEQ